MKKRDTFQKNNCNFNVFQLKHSLQLETFLGLHDSSHNTFCHGLAPGKVLNTLDHLGIGVPFVA